MPKRSDDWRAWVPLAAMILGAGMWLGRLQMQVTQLEHFNLYQHGAVTAPQEK